MMMLILTIWDILDTIDTEDDDEEKERETEKEKTKKFLEDHLLLCSKKDEVREAKKGREY